MYYQKNNMIVYRAHLLMNFGWFPMKSIRLLYKVVLIQLPPVQFIMQLQFINLV